MAPITRTARKDTQVGKGPINKPTRKSRTPAPAIPKPTRVPWGFHPVGGRLEDDVLESVETNKHDYSPELDEYDHQEQSEGVDDDVEEAIKPLREMADRVGREVETFAISFDEFISDLRTNTDKYESASNIVGSYRDVAADEATDLQKSHQKERMAQLTKEWSQRAHLSTTGESQAKASRSGVTAEMKAEKVKKMRKWQQEADIWDLFYIVLNFWYAREARKKETEDILANIAPSHRYTPEKEIWERFLLENEVAKEHALYKQWFERTAEHQGSDLPSIMQELETRSDTGKGLWNRGWLNTRETIKGEKRVRSWPSGSDSVQPQIRTSVGNDMLVTNLDPDAPTRQDRTLEKPDKYFERAVWIACWEMLRRGMSWEEIMAWCEDHNEGWRAAVLSPALDSSDALSNAAWRKMCYLASESGCSNDYEAAVYGLLGGNLKAVQKVCRTVDDHLFAHYSCALVRLFDHYLQNRYPGRVESLAVRRAGDDDIPDTEEKAQASISQVLKQLRADPTTHEEAITPLKMIESYLLANDAESLTATVGSTVSNLDILRGEVDKEVVARPAPSDRPAEAAITEDSHALRIVTHIYCILTAIDPEDQPPESLDAEESVLSAYIQDLRDEGNRDSIPVYASRLRPGRAASVMSHVLHDIHDAREQKSMLSLIHHYGMPFVGIVKAHVKDTLAGLKRLPKVPVRIVEDSKVSRLHPGRRIINGFLEHDVTDQDMAAVRALQWVQMVPGQWGLTFQTLADTVRMCLLHGRLACAVAIVHDFPSATIADQKSYAYFHRNTNILDKPLDEAEDTSEEALRHSIMRRQAQPYCDLESLVLAIEALALWVEHEREITATTPKENNRAPAALRLAKQELDEAMAPLLTGALLQQAGDEREQAEVDRIRELYVPEVLIAYATALYTAGPTITREAYIEAMDLSSAIAAPASQHADGTTSGGLAETVLAAGRMRELVRVFALTSRMMLVMDNMPGKAKRGKDKQGRYLGLWEIGPQLSGGPDGGIGVEAAIDQS